jgi:ATP-dependent helicase IRC3
LCKAYQEHAAGRKALAFLPSVALAEATARQFGVAGIPAAHVSGRTPLLERREIVADLKAGRLHVVANCGVLTEGFDDPGVDCILLARPTHSHGLYVQMVGRVLRTFPGKECALVIDFVGASSRHTLQTLGRLFPRTRAHGCSVLEAEEAEEAAQAAAEAERVTRSEAARRAAETRRWRDEQESAVAALVGHRVDLFHREPLHWTQGCGLYVLAVEGGCLVLAPAGNGLQDPDRYRVLHIKNWRVAAQLARQPLPLEYAQGVAEDWARRNGADSLARWQQSGSSRQEPASENQLQRWRRRGKTPPAGLTRGRASELIALADALEALARERRTA